MRETGTLFSPSTARNKPKNKKSNQYLTGQKPKWGIKPCSMSQIKPPNKSDAEIHLPSKITINAYIRFHTIHGISSLISLFLYLPISPLW